MDIFMWTSEKKHWNILIFKIIFCLQVDERPSFRMSYTNCYNCKCFLQNGMKYSLKHIFHLMGLVSTVIKPLYGRIEWGCLMVTDIKHFNCPQLEKKSVWKCQIPDCDHQFACSNPWFYHQFNHFLLKSTICQCLPPDKAWHKVKSPKAN